MENKGVQRVKTPQELIHIKHSISAVQYKYWFILIKIFQEYFFSGVEPDKNGFYSVPILEIEKMMGYELNRSDLKADLFSLSGTAVAFNYLNKNGENVFYGASFLPEFKVFSKTLKFILPSFIRNIIQGDDEIKKMFLIMDWNIFNSFNGKYEAIIYKLCKDYLGFGKTKYMSIKTYRDYIGLKDNEYKEFKALNRRAISEPIENINKNELSDIFVTVKFKRENRKIIGLHFEIKPKNKTPILDITPLEQNSVFEKCSIPINPQKKVEYLQKYSNEQIEAIIDYVNNQDKQGKIKNLGAYYRQAFENGWGLENFEAKQKKKAEADEKKRQAEAERQEKLKKAAEEKAEKEKIRQEQERCFAVFESLPQNEQEAILDEIEEKMKQTMPFFLKGFKEDRKNGLKPYRKPPQSFTLVGIIHSRNL